ncbi:MAG: MetQ/NlpA family ABC transporter substrate-binding protein [Succinivibrio dextrinosolvens]|uniref:MetQ/NlpA family ABC transporter substrate-binding protein n=1 Tax=Succinivibrio sp. TaxID=2053619 RepID=UPI0025D5DCB8|nr:MetQ/NlpA family ABC transporter substrate-binding protein [Succinivibrio sp.]MBQ9221720.1 MetQ/NlpA family ABC transporter substrate-binding protein [Succinivibrio sp.]MDY6420353.1 MetQ/NlpA family ABC transporter substrate-binding protein [Succinivibrio dextrinosolvens]
MKNIKNLLSAAFVGLTFFTASAAFADEPNEVKLGVVGEHNEAWEDVVKRLKNEGVNLTLVKFADYTLPNRALNDGEIDLNAFQHVAYLKADVEAHDYKIEPIANTIIAPLGLYSKKIKNVSELKDGDTIAIPNDPTNGGRALKVLELAGIIKLDPSKGYIPTVRDITENPKNIQIYEVDAGNTPSLLPDVAAAIINSNYAVDNDLNPTTDPIFSDGVGKVDLDNPYINIIAARSDNKDNPLFKKIIAAYQTKETAEIIKELYHGGEVPVFNY